MPTCFYCKSTAAYWSITDEKGNTSHYCDPCFTAHDLAAYKQKMDEFHKTKPQREVSAHKCPSDTGPDAASRRCEGCGAVSDSVVPITLEAPGGRQKEMRLCFACLTRAMSGASYMRVE